MRFISKFPSYNYQVKNETVAFRMLPGGTVTRDITDQPYVAEFKLEAMLPAYERLYAMQSFLGQDPRPFGAMPDTQAQAIVDATGRVVEMTAEFRPDLQFSLFDSDDIDDDDLRELAEQRLLSDAMLGVDYIVVEQMKVPPPWPTYDDCDLKTAINMVRHGGFDPFKVLEYEKAHANREDWIIEIGKLMVEQQEEMKAKDSLTITIP